MTILRDVAVHRDRLRSPYLRMLFDYWDGLRQGRVAPDVADIDALDMPRIALPYVIMIDVEHQPLRVKYRLVGSHGVEAAGWDYTGKYVDELDMPNDMVQALHENFAYAVAGKPLFGNYDWPLTDGYGSVTVELIQLPLLQAGLVTRCLCAEHVGQDQDLSSDEIVPIGINV